jgi:hypothetical protein
MRKAEPNVLIVSGRNKRMSYNVAAHYTSLGAVVMIVEYNLRYKHLIIENLNEKGVKYASITREVSDELEAREVLHNYLEDCSKDDIVDKHRISGHYTPGGRRPPLQICTY